MQIAIVKGKWTVIVQRVKVTDNPERAQNSVICLIPNMYTDYEMTQQMENRRQRVPFIRKNSFRRGKYQNY